MFITTTDCSEGVALSHNDGDLKEFVSLDVQTGHLTVHPDESLPGTESTGQRELTPHTTRHHSGSQL